MCTFTYTMQVNVNSGLCLAVATWSTANPVPPVQLPCTVGDVRLRCLDVPDGHRVDGLGLQLWDCNPNTANMGWDMT